MSSQCRPIPLYPNPPFSPQVEPASDEFSDFPPIRERKSTPDPPTSVPNHSHPRSPVAQKQSEWHSSPIEEPLAALSQLPRRNPRRHPPKSVTQKQSEQPERSSPSKELVAPSQLRRKNLGLGNRNRLNTIEASVSVRHSKVRCQNTFQAGSTILIGIMSEHFQILRAVEARRRCSRG